MYDWPAFFLFFHDFHQKRRHSESSLWWISAARIVQLEFGDLSCRLRYDSELYSSTTIVFKLEVWTELVEESSNHKSTCTVMQWTEFLERTPLLYDRQSFQSMSFASIKLRVRLFVFYHCETSQDRQVLFWYVGSFKKNWVELYKTNFTTRIKSIDPIFTVTIQID